MNKDETLDATAEEILVQIWYRPFWKRVLRLPLHIWKLARIPGMSPRVAVKLALVSLKQMPIDRGDVMGCDEP